MELLYNIVCFITGISIPLIYQLTTHKVLIDKSILTKLLEVYRIKAQLNLIYKMKRDIKPFTYDLYSSFYIHPKLVDSNGNQCKIDFVYLNQSSEIQEIYFIRTADRSRIKAEDVFIVIPTKEELKAAEEVMMQAEKKKSENIY